MALFCWLFSSHCTRSFHRTPDSLKILLSDSFCNLHQNPFQGLLFVIDLNKIFYIREDSSSLFAFVLLHSQLSVISNFASQGSYIYPLHEWTQKCLQFCWKRISHNEEKHLSIWLSQKLGSQGTVQLLTSLHSLQNYVWSHLKWLFLFSEQCPPN